MNTQAAPPFKKNMPQGIVTGDIENCPPGIRYMQNGWYYGPKFNPICPVPSEADEEPTEAAPERELTVAERAAEAKRKADEAVLAAKLAADEARRAAEESAKWAQAAAAADDGAVDPSEAARDPLPGDPDPFEDEDQQGPQLPYEEWDWRSLRAKMNELGGTYTNQVEAVEWLNANAPLGAE